MEIIDCMVHEEGHNVFLVLLVWTISMEENFANIVVVVVIGKHIVDMAVVIGLIADIVQAQ